jgi:hypothetical protein
MRGCKTKKIKEEKKRRRGGDRRGKRDDGKASMPFRIRNMALVDVQ